MLVLGAVVGCAGHAAQTEEARSALDMGQPRKALALLNEQLEVDSAKQVPADIGGDQALFLLDRAMVLQQLDQYKLSSRDLGIADKRIDILDLSRNAADDVGRYMFSDDTGPYKAPAYEKLMINTMNMVNYLVLRDLNGARVEARRLTVIQRFIKEHEDPGAALSGPGSYLAGFIFEKSGKPDEALRFYDDALSYGSYRSLVEPVRRLAKKSSVRSARIRALLKDAPPAPAQTPSKAEEPPVSPDEGGQLGPGAATEDTSDAAGDEAPEDEAPTEQEHQAKAAAPPEDGELLVIVSFGRVPAKFAKRVPIGLALTYASGALSPGSRQRASYLAAQGLVTWVNYPELGKARGQYDIPDLAVDRNWQTLEGIVAVDREAKRAWEAARGTVVAAAITRMLTRVVAGEAIRRGSGGGTLGALLSLGTQATLTATDTPDTRSWATLPARIAFGRMRLPPGEHVVWVRARGVAKQQKIAISPGGYAVVNLTVLN